MVDARLLVQLGARNRRCQVAAELDRDDPVFGAVEHEGRNLDLVEHLTHVHVEHQLDEVAERVAARRRPLVALMPRAELGVGGERRSEDDGHQRLLGAPGAGDHEHEAHPFGPLVLGESGRDQRCPRPREDQPFDPLGVGHGEQHRHRPTLGVPPQRRSLDSGVVHHRAQIVDPFVHAGHDASPVRAPRSPLVEVQVAAERPEPLEHRPDARLFPGHLDVLGHGWDAHDGRTLAPDLVGEAGAVPRRELHGRNLGHQRSTAGVADVVASTRYRTLGRSPRQRRPTSPARSTPPTSAAARGGGRLTGWTTGQRGSTTTASS